jgi:hypothetical protein
LARRRIGKRYLSPGLGIAGGISSVTLHGHCFVERFETDAGIVRVDR